jgi:hypothetical protein
MSPSSRTPRLPLLFVLLLFLSSPHPVVPAGSTTIYLAYPSPLSGPVWDGGKQMTPAVDMAIEAINAQSDLLPGYTLATAMFDHQVRIW